MTLVEAPDGLRLARALVALAAEVRRRDLADLVNVLLGVMTA